MLPKWFDKWNSENPKDVFGPGILVGVVGGAVVVAALLVSWGGRPFAVQAMQTGPAGTGMSVTDFVSDAATPDPTAALYTTAAPVVPTGGEQLAKDAYPNAEPLLGDLTVANYDRLVAAMRTWTGIPDLLAGEENYQTLVARNMIQMTQSLNDGWGGHTNVSGQAGVNCYTCHRGQPVPTNVWYQIDRTVQVMSGWGGVQNRVTPVSQYTSLPSTALQSYLLDAQTIAVHDLESRVPGRPSDEGYLAWQHTERTYSLMNYFSNSLGVNCVFCHNSRAFYDVGQNTPQWATAQLGIGMVQDVNNTWLLPVADLLPPERLGPALASGMANGPMVGCATCHKGYQKPLGGMDMVTDWPELAAPGAPVYQ